LVLVAGFDHSSLLTLEGLESVRRIDFGPVVLDEATARALPERWAERPRREGRQTLDVAIDWPGAKVSIDGRLDDWPASTAWAEIGETGEARAALRVSGGRLVAAFRTGEPGLLDTADGGDVRYQFKRGGALDLMIGTDPRAAERRPSPVPGDLRLLVTRAG